MPKIVQELVHKYDLIWQFDYLVNFGITVLQRNNAKAITDCEKRIIDDYLYYSYGYATAIFWRTLSDKDDVGTLVYKVLSHDYLDSEPGSGRMMSTFRVFLPKENKVLWVLTSRERGTVSSVDFVFDLDENGRYMLTTEYNCPYILCTIIYGQIVQKSKYDEMIQHCRFLHYSKEYDEYGLTPCVSYNDLPDIVLRQLTDDERVWLQRHPNANLTTDGRTVFLPTEYTLGLTERLNDQLQTIKDFFSKTKTLE